MSNSEFIKRAFELADSGDYSQVSQVRAILTREGFSLREIHQLSGKQLARQLKVRMTAARLQKAAGK